MAAPRTLAPVRPYADLRDRYRARLIALLEAMRRSLLRWIRAAYRANPPEMAADESPARALNARLRQLGRYWTRRWSDAAPELADYFATEVAQRSETALRVALRRHGISVRFRRTRAMNDVMQATVQENVSLIRSIPQNLLTQVEGSVMRSVAAGRDLHQLTEDLEHIFGVARRRAELIARDQNNKATAMLSRVRQRESGITEAIWIHSTAGKTPRPSHLKAGRERVRFNLAEGWWDPDEKKHILPGELINCLPGDSLIHLADGVEKAYRRLYSGQLTTLVTETGETLCATLNHPVLTPRGWVSVGSLDEGDYIVELGDDGISVLAGEGYDDQAVPTISEIYDSTLEAGRAWLEVSARDQFHGDGIADGYVDVADAARSLRFGRKIYCEAGCEKFLLAVPDDPNLRVGSFSLPEDTFPFPSDGYVRRVGERHPTFRTESHHPGFVAFADLRTRGVSSSGDLLPPLRTEALHPGSYTLTPSVHLTACAEDEGLDRLGGLTIGLRERSQSTSSLVLATKKSRVVRNVKSFFSGHVYNLQTVGGWYAAGAIIAGNCRCVSRPVVPGFTP